MQPLKNNQVSSEHKTTICGGSVLVQVEPCCLCTYTQGVFFHKYFPFRLDWNFCQAFSVPHKHQQNSPDHHTLHPNTKFLTEKRNTNITFQKVVPLFSPKYFSGKKILVIQTLVNISIISRGDNCYIQNSCLPSIWF